MPFQSSFFRARKCHTECCWKQAERNVTWRQVEERQPSSGWTATDSAPTSVGLRVSAPRTSRNGQLSIICPGGLGVNWEFGHSFRRGLPYKGLSWYMYVATRDFLGGLPYRTFLECCHLGLSEVRLALWPVRWDEVLEWKGWGWGGRKRDTTRHLGEPPPTVLPQQWGWGCRFQEPAVTGSIRLPTYGEQEMGNDALSLADSPMIMQKVVL